MTVVNAVRNAHDCNVKIALLNAILKIAILKIVLNRKIHFDSLPIKF